MLKSENPAHAADRAMSHLMRLGFSPIILMKLATFQVQWTIFETMLEPTLWAMNDEDPKGVHPSTDGKQVSELINRFAKSADKFPVELRDLIVLTSRTASLLLRYRNGISHGFVLPAEVGGPGFLSNPQWHGEKRKRPHSDALVVEWSLDLALYAILAISEVRLIVEKVAKSAPIPNADELKRLMDRGRNAKGMASELVHRVALANHEKC